MENMYTGKSSKNPNMPLIWGLLVGLGLIAFGVYLYFDLADWENSNEEMHLNALLWALYDLGESIGVGGKESVAGFFGLVGTMLIGSGVKKTSDLRKLKKEARN